MEPSINIIDGEGNTFVKITILKDINGNPCEVIVNGISFKPDDMTLNGVKHLGRSEILYATSPEEVQENI